MRLFVALAKFCISYAEIDYIKSEAKDANIPESAINGAHTALFMNFIFDLGAACVLLVIALRLFGPVSDAGDVVLVMLSGLFFMVFLEQLFADAAREKSNNLKPNATMGDIVANSWQSLIAMGTAIVFLMLLPGALMIRAEKESSVTRSQAGALKMAGWFFSMMLLGAVIVISILQQMFKKGADKSSLGDYTKKLKNLGTFLTSFGKKHKCKTLVYEGGAPTDPTETADLVDIIKATFDATLHSAEHKCQPYYLKAPEKPGDDQCEKCKAALSPCVFGSLVHRDVVSKLFALRAVSGLASVNSETFTPLAILAATYLAAITGIVSGSVDSNMDNTVLWATMGVAMVVGPAMVGGLAAVYALRLTDPKPAEIKEPEKSV
jgi:hypothetical protein